MKRGILVKRSRAAAWARSAGALAVPVLVVGALASRAGLVPEPALVPVLALGFALGALALVLSIYALVDIWNSGAEGAGAAITAIVYALPSLIVLAAIAVAAIVYPRLTDVSTDPVNPPVIEERAGVQVVTAPDPALQARAYPDIAPRVYAQPIAAVYAAARDLVEKRGWDVLRDVPPQSMPEPPAGQRPRAPEPVDAVLSAKATMTQSRSEAARPAAPEEPPEPVATDSATLQAVAPTPVFGFPDDVVIEFREGPTGTRVDVRSVSRIGMHDLGQNARRIRRLLAHLDMALQPDPNAPVRPAPPAGPVAGVGELPAPPPEAAPSSPPPVGQ